MKSVDPAFLKLMEISFMKLLPLVLQIIRLQLPHEPRKKDANGHYPVGSVVYYTSTSKNGALLSGVIEYFAGDYYDIRVKDGSKEFNVAETKIVYSSPPLFSLSVAAPILDTPSSSMSAPSADDIDFNIGSTSHLLLLLKYLVCRRTSERILDEVSVEEIQLSAEQVLSVLTVTLLHISLGPVDKNLFHDTVADIHDTIDPTTDKSEWLRSPKWSEISSWCKSVLPLPEPEIEIEPTYVDDSHLAFRK